MGLQSRQCSSPITTTLAAVYFKFKDLTSLLLVQQHSEVLFTEGTRFPVSKDPCDASMAEVLSTTAGEGWLSGDVQTDRALVLFQLLRSFIKQLLLKAKESHLYYNSLTVLLTR